MAKPNRPAKPPSSTPSSTTDAGADRPQGKARAAARSAPPALDIPDDLSGLDVLAPPASAPAGPATESDADQRARLELQRARLEVERAELEVAGLRRREAEAGADAGEAQIYTFYSEVTPESVELCMRELGRWSRRSPGVPITVIFNSPGGSVLDGFALYDYLRLLRAEGHHVTTLALGRAASMGAVLLQAGDRRVIGANAFVLVHEVSSGSVGKVSELEDSVTFTRRLQARMLAILAERSTLTTRQIQQRWARKEWWLDAGEVVAAGLADEIR